MVKPELVEMYKSLCKRGRKKQRVMELMSEAIKTKEIFMDDKHIFNKETDSEMLAMDIVTFLQKWGTLRFYGLYQAIFIESEAIIMVSKIYFDLDGVLADFDRGVMELAGFNRNGANANSDIKDDDMWQAIARVSNFYDKLELMPGAKEMFNSIYKKYGDKVEILTGIPKPKRNILTASEDKTNWVHRLLGTEIKVNTVFREEKKNFCTGPECILIDDLKKNINEWEAYGGTGILFTNSEEVLQEIYRKIEMME